MVSIAPLFEELRSGQGSQALLEGMPTHFCIDIGVLALDVLR